MELYVSLKKPELCIFAISSAYFRVVKNNRAKVSFVIGKNQLAPLKEKRLSTPKLELQAAVTAAQVRTKTKL